MTSVEIVFGLLLAAMVIAVAAKRLDLPFPIALVVAGLGLALIPGVPRVKLDPQIVFFLLLPPILSEAAYFTSWHDFWRLRRPIFLLAFGLVGFTTVTVAFLCVTFIPGMNWATGLVLGAIVAPPDAAAATSITRGLRLPRRIVQILEGESLVNDASALTAYRFSVIAVAGGAFIWQEALVSMIWIPVGGTLIGLILAWVVVWLFPKIRDVEVEILVTILLSYLSYFLAETVHSSGVLAAVSSGLYLGWHAPRLFHASTRIRAHAVWQTLIFVINALVFILIGLQLPEVLMQLQGYPATMLVLWCLIISGGVMLVRIVWVLPATYLPRYLSASIRAKEPRPPLAQVSLVAWTGLRGVVSLAAALALPETTRNGLPFPYRDLLILLTFSVILSTLLIQGLTLRPLIRKLGVPKDFSSEEEQLAARIYATEKALGRLAELERDNQAKGTVAERVRGYFEDRLAGYRAQLEEETGTEEVDRPDAFRSLAEQKLWWELAGTERQALMELRSQRKIGDEALREVEREIDLLEERIVPRN